MKRHPLAAAVDHARMRELNLTLILDRLRQEPNLSRAELAHRTGLTRPTVSSLVAALIADGFVREVGAVSSPLGRPSIALALNPQAGFLLGAEIGVDFIAAVLTDFSAQVVWQTREALKAAGSREEVLEAVLTMLQEGVDLAKNASLPLLGIGLGVPGLVDRSSGRLLFAPNLGWRDVPLKALLEERIQTDVIVDNEANLAALGESTFGAARGAHLVLYVSSGVGLGGGLVLDGQLFQGSDGFAGEFGHMTVDPGGLPCNCGSRGCWETLVSQWAVFRRIRAAAQAGAATALLEMTGGDLQALTFEQVCAAAANADAIALAALEETGHYLGIGIASLVNAFNPQLVVFGGILSTAFEYLLPGIQAEVEQRALQWARQNLRIIPAQYGRDACPLGGVAAVYREVLMHPARVRRAT